jgi:hypothetical protein
MTVYVINSNGDKFKVTEFTAESERIVNTNKYTIKSVTADEMILEYAPNNEPYEEDNFWGMHHMV